jgi:hypothetical protein
MSSASGAPSFSALAGKQKPDEEEQQKALALATSGRWDTFKPWETPYEPLDRFVESFQLSLLQRNALFVTTHRYKGDDYLQHMLLQALKASVPRAKKDIFRASIAFTDAWAALPRHQKTQRLALRAKRQADLVNFSFQLSETLEQYINRVSELWLALDPITDPSVVEDASETNPVDEEQAVEFLKRGLPTQMSWFVTALIADRATTFDDVFERQQRHDKSVISDTAHAECQALHFGRHK